MAFLCAGLNALPGYAGAGSHGGRLVDMAVFQVILSLLLACKIQLDNYTLFSGCSTANKFAGVLIIEPSCGGLTSR
jgi:hypothetical protein